MIAGWIGKIREKPESTRWAITISLTMVIGAILVTAWVKNLSGQLASMNQPPSRQNADAPSLSASLLDPLHKIGEAWGALRSGQDPEVATEEFRGTVEANASAKPLESPSVARYFLSGFMSALRYNLAAVGAAFNNLASGRF
ncbi:MAG: hypothetical protein A3C12_01165 [Candidatus Sungbacteria bacterium RIFCSPHIGHO2_02_FULL_49_20]|uniref:Uncharacterized protein n=1 Tax=Candidatus Sungbacteria bacterium RIFCSPHIGHO2_02_FULL_49_20 TaxID=1802272 RepID=A0A1G2KUQ5_9BACT|nr:MAG: hypothetical protein A3C12_01165 [Candidatus Sungbacteria bacterium RIFCSPHIGHO2_02_FULL_49_20]